MKEKTRYKPIDTAIINACQKQEASAQKVFYEHFGKLVLSVCLRYAANRPDAEDIFQESFITIFEQIKTLKNPDGIISWIYKIVISKVTRYYRKRVKMVEATDWNVQVVRDRSENEIIQLISTQELLTMVQKLPDGYRLVFNLYVMEGYSHKEIAQMLDINEATSRSQLFKAKQWLKDKIVKTYGLHNYEKRLG